MSNIPYEVSVEKARLALVKTFEGRVEAALASIEQIPLGQGRKADGQQTLAQFALDTGIEYATLGEYREITKWLGENPAPAGFSEDTARYRVGDIKVYSVARQGMKSKKWATGTLFAAFLDANEAPEPFARWTVDALRVHLGQKPTNTGKVALALAAGEDVTEDQTHAAAAADHAEEIRQEIEQIENRNEAAKAALGALGEIRKTLPYLDEFAAGIQADLGFWPNITLEVRALLEKLAEMKSWLDQHGSDMVPDPDGGKSERAAEIMLDVLAAAKGDIDLAFSEVGVGTTIEDDFNSLLANS